MKLIEPPDPPEPDDEPPRIPYWKTEEYYDLSKEDRRTDLELDYDAKTMEARDSYRLLRDPAE